MLVITGGAGLIGSNLALALNRAGHDDLVIVDDMTNGSKLSNLAGVKLIDYIGQGRFPPRAQHK